MQKILLQLVLIAAIAFFACKKEAPPQVQDDQFYWEVAPYLSLNPQAPDYRVAILPGYGEGLYPAALSNGAKATLGRVLFYDRNLSKDGKISCSSCHQPQFAFADGVAQSVGVFGRTTKRNSMALLNTIWLGASLGVDSTGDALLPFFWDSRVYSVTEQSKAAFTNPDEMGLTMPEVLQIVRSRPYYAWLLEQAWGDTSVNEKRIFESISHFICAMSVQNTPFDRALKQAGGDVHADFGTFTPELNRGKALYLDHCESCHGSLTSIQNVFEANNGLESPYIDPGKGGITGNFYEKGIFKVPGLRNIAESAPYMHDGRFGTLAQVVEHYNSGVKQVFGLHGDLLTFNPATQTYSPQRLYLQESDKQALVAFLYTLSDSESMADPRFSDPFRR